MDYEAIIKVCLKSKPSSAHADRPSECFSMVGNEYLRF